MQTIYTINTELQKSILGFNWITEKTEEEQNASFVPDGKQLDEAVNLVANSIIAASNIRSNFSEKAERELSLLEVCYIIAQESGKSSLTSDLTVKASFQERTFIHLIASKLKEWFVQVKEEDLKAATLLFGIHKVHEFVTSKILSAEPLSRLLQMQMMLTKMLEIRSKYDGVEPANLSEKDRDFLAKVDQSIVQAQAVVASLQEEEVREEKTW